MFTFGMLDGVLFHLGPIPVDHIVVTQWAIIALIGIVAFMATRNMQMVPRGLQNAFEALIVWTYDFFTQLMDKEHIAKKYAPLLSTFFLFIIVSNYSGLIPGAGQIPGYQPPTANWNTTLALALITAFTVQVAGFAEHGLHYLGHFVSPSPLMLPLNLLEEIAHPLSLFLRLFGNIFGEEMILAFMLFLAPFFVPSLLMGLSVLLAAIQAVVFTILSANYIATATGEGH
ncbi:ATP synthase F0 subcomplex A subunit [Thermosyntropha lipolytica DSM 11003]|uniref:ATP synthase subunit a n=1 Tax=Thermosyntropha lipolytica DSM 11003 TaxID=1123382 RepID=A0A1M5NVY9_9FIRM|nr:F0F1 ATP synthase subunit A [Thermosyntropha lipolytica]SHG93143.1 ATP synthase F0 subcomplex A subunit [Thermosyntropha lipolytica DSM 11003]